MNTARYSEEDITRFLSEPSTHGPEAGEIELIETHLSNVFLVGEKAFKLKRRVSLPYVDFSTVEQRKRACEAEVRLNSRTAPQFYKGVIPVNRKPDGTLELGGTGEVVDWVVETARFDQDQLFDRMALRGELDRQEMEDLAGIIDHFHESAETIPVLSGSQLIADLIEGNVDCLSSYGAGVLDKVKTEELTRLSKRALQKLTPLLDQRASEGKVRHCHGDLHLRNIFQHQGQPVIFDCIEFNDDIAICDIIYDLAFLLMDLDHRGLRRLASIAMNSYLDRSGDAESLALLPLFLSIRAAIRAHVYALQAHSLHDPVQAAERGREAASYLELALGYLAPVKPRLLAVGGLSGSGKSRLAREVACVIDPAPGARVVRTDIVRKRLNKVPFSDSLGAEGYTPEMTEKTYQAFRAELEASIKAGHSAIADAVFAKQQQREQVAELAASLDVALEGLWVDVSLEIREQRVSSRERNVSDVTVEIARQQMDYDLGEISWLRIDSSGPREATMDQAYKALKIRSD